MGSEPCMKVRNSKIWRRDRDSNEDGANTIKIISDRNPDVALGPGITIKNLEITFHKPSKRPKNFSLEKFLKLKHTRPLDPDQ
jgi:hypothetical protein